MTRVARRAVLLLACGVALAGLSAGSAHAQTFDPQPYLVYGVSPEIITPAPTVDLDDQFGLKEAVAVTQHFYFMNPVQKTPISPPGPIEPITDDPLHYRWYWLSQPPVETRTVLVTDQFGDEISWQISTEPSFLLAPTAKLIGTGDPGNPPPGQHYSCYHHPGFDVDPQATVQLDDQFAPYNPVTVGGAWHLCAPVEKTDHDQIIYPTIPAVDGRDHLACYSITQITQERDISTRTQFTTTDYDEVSTIGTTFLCVPAKKTHLSSVSSLRSGGIVALGLLMLLTAFWFTRHRMRHGAPA
jgi:hypothetical protein